MSGHATQRLRSVRYGQGLCVPFDRDIDALYRSYEEIRSRGACMGCEEYRLSLLNAAKALNRVGTRHALRVEQELRVWLAQAVAPPNGCPDPGGCMPLDPYKRFVRVLKLRDEFSGGRGRTH